MSCLGSPAGSPPFHSFIIARRVPVANPARSMNLNVGSTPTTTIEPVGEGFSREING
jgi:hypothetical protein